MKTMKSKFYSLALAAGMLTLTACSDDNTNDSNNDKGNGIENGSILKGTIHCRGRRHIEHRRRSKDYICL